jgi:class 3 adenylate cyclase
MVLTQLKEKYYTRYADYSYVDQQKSYLLFWFILFGGLLQSVAVILIFLKGAPHPVLFTVNILFLFICFIGVYLLWIRKYLIVRIGTIFILAAIFSIIQTLGFNSFLNTGINSTITNFLLLLPVITIFISRKFLIPYVLLFTIGHQVTAIVAKPHFDPVIYNRVLFFTTLFNIQTILLAVFFFFSSKITDNSLELAERELKKNKDLNANLEQKVKERTQRLKDIESSLKKYLPKQLVETITKGDHSAEPKTERRKLSVFFSDIKGFTDLTESMEAEDLSKLLNEYLTEMTNIANKWGGTVDKFIGDAVMIFFGAPEETPDDENAINCVKMAIEMQNKMKELQTKWFNEGIENPLEIRIGISTGTATVGNFGADDRLSYTVIGGQVNIASRLESLCEPGKILISHQTWAFVKDNVECKEREKVKVKGIQRELMVYDVVMS